MKQPKRQYADDQKMSDEELAESKGLAEDLKGKEGVDNPHALARWSVQRDALASVESTLADKQFYSRGQPCKRGESKAKTGCTPKNEQAEGSGGITGTTAPAEKRKAAAQLAKGEPCKKGETAAKTGCTPADPEQGGGGPVESAMPAADKTQGIRELQISRLPKSQQKALAAKKEEGEGGGGGAGVRADFDPTITEPSNSAEAEAELQERIPDLTYDIADTIEEIKQGTGDTEGHPGDVEGMYQQLDKLMRRADQFGVSPDIFEGLREQIDAANTLVGDVYGEEAKLTPEQVSHSLPPAERQTAKVEAPMAPADKTGKTGKTGKTQPPPKEFHSTTEGIAKAKKLDKMNAAKRANYIRKKTMEGADPKTDEALARVMDKHYDTTFTERHHRG